MYIISLIIIIILVTLYQSIYKYCEQIKIYKNQYRKKNINVLIIGGTHGNEPAGTHTLINFKKKIYDYERRQSKKIIKIYTKFMQISIYLF